MSSDLYAFYRELVRAVHAADPARVRAPIALAAVMQELLPYRVARRVLGLESAEDYELLLLRLGAGEGGFAALEPREAGERFQAELGSVNPDLSVVRSLDRATLTFSPFSLQLVLDEEQDAVPDARFAPPVTGLDGEPFDAPVPPVVPPPPPELLERLAGLDEDAYDAPFLPPPAPRPEPAAPPPPRALPAPTHGSAAACPHCAGALPAQRAVVFCPHCGRQLGPRRCARCGAEAEPGWRFCVSCGDALAER